MPDEAQRKLRIVLSLLGQVQKGQGMNVKQPEDFLGKATWEIIYKI